MSELRAARVAATRGAADGAPSSGAAPGPGPTDAGGDAVRAGLSALAAELRGRGVATGVGELLVAHRALAAVDPSAPADARAALRAALCSRRADLAAFDDAFAAVFGAGAARPGGIDPITALALPRAAAPADAPPEIPEGVDPDALPAMWSAVEVLHDKDFAAYSDAERRAARGVIARLAARGPVRPSRRTRPTRRRGHTPDTRRTIRASLRHAGEPIDRRWRAPTSRPRPLVLVCDVSGSMEPYARILLQYLQASVAGRRRVEAFVFGTRLSRVTHELAGRDADAALARAADAVADWSGGTRIGSALATLNREHGRRLGRGAVVVLLSDGWDRGDPDELAAEMARLHRCAHRLVWLNPLKAQPQYEPLARGMAAALPHIDDFLPGNSLASLAQLAALLEAATAPVGGSAR